MAVHDDMLQHDLMTTYGTEALHSDGGKLWISFMSADVLDLSYSICISGTGDVDHRLVG